MGLAVTTTLTLMGMVNSVFQTSPDTSYLKAMDVWLVTCFTFTFVVLGEFCTVIGLSQYGPFDSSSSCDRDKSVKVSGEGFAERSSGRSSKAGRRERKIRLAAKLETW